MPAGLVGGYYLREKNNINSKISHAFEKDKSIFTNVRIHKCKKYIVNLDLKDYFNSIHFGRVRGYFTNNNNYRLSLDIATIIAQLTCYHGYLPQGAHSSPIITNLISNIMDIRLLSIAKKYRLNYTRYADDLTFSTNDTKIIEKFDAFLNDVDKIVRNSGFSLDEEKTRLQYFSSRQVVTGLVVNKKLNISNSSKKLFEDKFYISLIENGNLFLATNHLVKDKSECEIEDLFDDELLELKLGNKVFDRSGKKDSKKYYSKDIFSKYVMKNYDDINFERFRPFLNNLNAIIKLWNNDMTKPS